MALHSFLLFSFFSCFLLLVPETALAADYLGAAYLTCMHNTTTGTPLSSTFKHNLKSALTNLTTLSSQGAKYAITSAGSGDDMVYAMFQCRGDQTLQLCSDCMANATVRLPERECPASIGARIQLDGCYLRYDNTSFFTPDFNYVTGYCFSKSSDPIALAAIESIVENVTTLAPKQGGFASTSANGEFAAAQCLGYLNESECSQCLTKQPYRTVCDSTLGEQLHLTSCYYRYEPYSFLAAPSPAGPVPAGGPAPESPMPSPTKTKVQGSNKASTSAIVGGSVGAAIIIIIVALCIIFTRRYKAHKTKGESHVMGKKNKGRGQQSLVLQTKAKVFLLKELEEATRYFHPNNKLGEGGYGPVYKGTLPHGENIAIKKLATTSRQGKKEFLNEVKLITSVQHKNLIRLLGCCVEGCERILVYEYLPNKSLDFLLFGDEKILEWSSRFGIILGMAKGLAYLHEESHIRIFHRDIKPSNILLDDQLNPVIADFGLARLVQDDETRVNTRVQGTIGYIAPEYAIHGELSEKVDVYSFGVVSLEIISGKQILNDNLLEWAWQLYLQNKVLDLVDPKLRTSFAHKQAIRIIHVALLCTQENSKQRPTMSTVTVWLSGASEILDLPVKPSFIELSRLIEPKNASDYEKSYVTSSIQYVHPNNRGSHLSGGALSISQMYPR